MFNQTPQRSTAVAIGWAAARRRTVAHLILLPLLLLALAGVRGAPPAALAPERMVRVIVTGAEGFLAGIERAVAGIGGSVSWRLESMDAVIAEVPANAVRDLSATRGVVGVSPDRPVRMSHSINGFNAVADAGSAYNLNRFVQAPNAWSRGYTGEGVDVAVIDTGVAPVNGLSNEGAVINGPDLSLEAPDASLRYLDTYGHGTAMAGIIAGRDDSIPNGPYTSHDVYAGVAPKSRIVNVKVANSQGVTDVSQVIAAIDWVILNAHSNGLNIRVLNLSFGTDGIQDYRIDPLARSAEIAWRHGIVVVVSAGNTGFGDEQLNNPAYDPYVIAVGAADTKGTMSASDDTIPDWSTRGNASRHPDLVAPGKSVAGLRVPESHVDQAFPQARVGSRYMRGSGTSQAAAVVSGAAALLLDQRPLLTPDQVKKLLMDSATPLPSADALAQGEGLLNVKGALDHLTPLLYVQTHQMSDGSGSLEDARGSMHVASEDGDIALEGEVDIFGHEFDSGEWSVLSWLGDVWDGGAWNGTEWIGDCFCAESVTGTVSWEAVPWSSSTWDGHSWSGHSWSGHSWSGHSWSGHSWSGHSWSGHSWSGHSWSTAGWGDEA